MTGRTVPADEDVRRGRMRKAEQFARAAEGILGLVDDAADVADAYVTLCVHAGIAAADVICAARLGLHSRGEDHGQAVTLLATVERDAASHLRSLLGVKTVAGCGHQRVRDRTVRAGRDMDALLVTARGIARRGRCPR